MNSPRIPVAVLGATGMVGQRLLSLLERHPWFEARELVASERSAGRTYGEAVSWRLPGEPPASVMESPVRSLDEPLQSSLVFSGLGSDVARRVEESLADEGRIVVSNASAHRMDPDIPLLIPEINAHHLAALEPQRARRPSEGFLVTNPNCSTIGLALALAPLHRVFGLRRASVVTLQAVSGAGWPGVPSLAVGDNVVPWIEGEAAKIEAEPRKILGAFREDRFEPAALEIGARVHRVPVTDGHLLCVSVELESEPAGMEDLVQAFRDFRGEPQELGLPSAPKRPLHYLEASDRPQPALDRHRENGMAVSVGGLETCPILGYRFEALVHNTVRGAAGATLLNAELLHARGYLEGLGPPSPAPSPRTGEEPS